MLARTGATIAESRLAQLEAALAGSGRARLKEPFHPDSHQLVPGGRYTQWRILDQPYFDRGAGAIVQSAIMLRRPPRRTCLAFANIAEATGGTLNVVSR